MITVLDVAGDSRVNPANKPADIISKAPKAVNGMTGPTRNKAKNPVMVEFGRGPKGIMVSNTITNITDSLQKIRDSNLESNGPIRQRDRVRCIWKHGSKNGVLESCWVRVVA